MDIITKDRTFDSGRALDPNDALFELKTSINNVVGACLITATVPFTYYVFDTGKNTFKVGATTVTIPTQTCNSVTLPYVLSTAMAASGVASASSYNSFVDNTTSQLVMYSTSGAFTLDFTNAESAEALGFSQTVYNSQTGITVYGNDDVAINPSYHFIISPFTVNLSGPTQMYLHCRYVGPAMNGGISNDSNSSDIIGTFRVNTNYQGTITYTNYAPAMFNAQISSLRKVQLYLTVGSESQPLNLRGAKFQAQIRFFCSESSTAISGSDEYGNRTSSVSSAGTPHMRQSESRRTIPKRKLFGA